MILVITVKEELGKELMEIAHAQGDMGVNRFVEKDLEERWLPHLTLPKDGTIPLPEREVCDDELQERSA